MSATRIDDCFARLRRTNRAALVTFLTAGDPDPETSLAILKALPAAGADLIELGMPFTDPMADGPAIQAAGLRALKAGQNMKKTLAAVRDFRNGDDTTPLVLMGYYNPIYIYGVERFLHDAKTAGVDGLIVVDLPPEEDEELCLPALRAGIAFIRLATPTTDDKRLPAVLANTSGFVYYVSITGITGAAMPDPANVAAAVARIKRHTSLPVAVGFGVRTAEQASVIASCADGVVVGSALVNALKGSLDPDDKPTAKTVTVVINLVAELARGVRGARGISGVQLPEASEAKTRARLTQRYAQAREAALPAEVQRAIEAIAALLDGEPKDLCAVALDMDGIAEFDRRVYEAARAIPAGATLSYGELAARLGERALAGGVGQALGRNPFPLILPCHRVLAAGAKAGGFSANGGVATKLALLTIERARTSDAPTLFDEDPAFGFARKPKLRSRR